LISTYENGSRQEHSYTNIGLDSLYRHAINKATLCLLLQYLLVELKFNYQLVHRGHCDVVLIGSDLVGDARTCTWQAQSFDWLGKDRPHCPEMPTMQLEDAVLLVDCSVWLRTSNAEQAMRAAWRAIWTEYPGTDYQAIFIEFYQAYGGLWWADRPSNSQPTIEWLENGEYRSSGIPDWPGCTFYHDVLDLCKDSVDPELTLGVVKRIEGFGNNSWKLVDWNQPISADEESKFNCNMVVFQSTMSGKEALMCVHDDDLISNSIKSGKHWPDCDILSKIWNDGARANDDKSLYYVEIGANIGGCILEMLLSTNASIIAFEPHPMNIFNLKKTVSHLDKSYQNRLMLFSIGIGDASATSTIHSASGNMGNSGKSPML